MWEIAWCAFFTVAYGIKNNVWYISQYYHSLYHIRLPISNNKIFYWNREEYIYILPFSSTSQGFLFLFSNFGMLHFRLYVLSKTGLIDHRKSEEARWQLGFLWLFLYIFLLPPLLDILIVILIIILIIILILFIFKVTRILYQFRISNVVKVDLNIFFFQLGVEMDLFPDE